MITMTEQPTVEFETNNAWGLDHLMALTTNGGSLVGCIVVVAMPAAPGESRILYLADTHDWNNGDEDSAYDPICCYWGEDLDSAKAAISEAFAKGYEAQLARDAAEVSYTTPDGDLIIRR